MNATALFKTVLDSSWQGSLVIVLILLIRPLLGMRVPARWRYLLWTLVLFRLLVPAFLLPRSPASFENIPAVQHPVERAEMAIDRNSTAGSTFNERVRQGPEEGEPRDLEPLSPAPIHGGGRQSWWKLAALMWVAGSIALGALIVTATIALRRRLKPNVQALPAGAMRVWEECCSRLALGHPPRLVMTRAVESPALLGVMRPLLLIPAAALEDYSQEDWEHVFMHELAHFRRRDHWAHALQLVTLCVHWFNPLVWIGFRCLRADREMATDEWALKRLGEGSGAAYGRTLLKILTPRIGAAFRPAVIGIGESAAELKTRLKRIARFGPRRTLGSVLGVAVSLILAAIVLGRQLSGAEMTDYAGLEPPQILVTAAANGDLAVMRRALEDGVDINASAGTVGDQTALAGAAAANQIEAMRLLVAKGAAINAPDGTSPALIAALKHGRTDCARYLIENGAKCDASLLAAASGDEPEIRKLLAAPETKTEMLKQLCAIAAVNGHATLFAKLVDAVGSRPGQANWELGRDEITRAIARGHSDVIEALIKRHAFLNYPGVLRLAGAVEQTQGMREWLAARGVNVPAYSDGERLIDAVEAENLPALRRLLASGVNINFAGESQWTPLTRGAIAGRERAVALLIEHGADLNARKGGLGGYTALCFAKTTRIADRLLAAGADLQAGIYGGSVHQISYPVTFGPAELVKWFLDHGIDPTKVPVGPEGPTFLFQARTVEIVRLLIERGVDVRAVDKEGRTALHQSQWRSEPGMVARLLLEHGADPNARDKHGVTPLHCARDAATVEALIAAGAKIDAKDNEGNGVAVFLSHMGEPDIDRLDALRRAGLKGPTPEEGLILMHSAILRNEVAMLKNLLDSGIDPNPRGEPTLPGLSRFSPLSSAIGNPEMVALLRKAGANDVGVLSEAAANGDLPRIRALLGEGADLEERSNAGDTPLTFAASHGQVEAVRLLLERGANVNRFTANGLTAPLLNEYLRQTLRLPDHYRGKWSPIRGMSAAQATQAAEAISALLSARKPDVNWRDEHGETGLHCAAATGNTLLGLFFTAGADINAQRPDGMTPLMLAIVKQPKNALREGVGSVSLIDKKGGVTQTFSEGAYIVKILLEKGADLSLRNKAGKTALDLARENGNEEILALLGSTKRE